MMSTVQSSNHSPSISPVNATPLPQNFDKVPEDNSKYVGGETKKLPATTGAGSATAVFASGGILRQQISGGAPPTAIIGTSTIPSTLPPEKVFSIQIGSELFRLSGASISSDGQYFMLATEDISLRVLEHRHIFPSFLKNNFVKQQMVAV
jgi:hypothetical protein